MRYEDESLYKLLGDNTLSSRLEWLIFKIVICSVFSYGPPLYRGLYEYILIKVQQVEIRILGNMAINAILFNFKTMYRL